MDRFIKKTPRPTASKAGKEVFSVKNVKLQSESRCTCKGKSTPGLATKAADNHEKGKKSGSAFNTTKEKTPRQFLAKWKTGRK